MQRRFMVDSDIYQGVLKVVLGNADDRPDWEDLPTEARDELLEWAGQDDYLINLLVLREAAYDHSNELPDGLLDGTGDALESEMFRAAEWLDSAVRLYVRDRIEAHLGEEADGDR
jgi:hypothetical protein